MSHLKLKEVSKDILCEGPELDKKILATMKTISDVVGATLGPGGKPILIERQENNLPSIITKDGVTVFRHLGFKDPVAHEIMATARDAAVRTASEAGDGTTTATVLAETIVKFTHDFCKAHPKTPPQVVVRRLESAFKRIIEPAVRKLSTQIDFSTEEGQKIAHSVARISANGDTALADAVIECFELVGDDGNVTLLELSGPSHYEVERLEGYPVGVGYEDSCGRFFPEFINDQGQQRVFLEKPIFLLYHGQLNSIYTLAPLIEQIFAEWQAKNFKHQLVVVATGFSEQVLGALAQNFTDATTVKVYPMVIPRSPFQNGAIEFLRDLSAATGAKIFEPLKATIDTALPDDLGRGVAYFEASRYRSNIVLNEQPDDGPVSPEMDLPDEGLIQIRAEELEQQMQSPESDLERIYLQERIGKLTGGIAKLKVIGASNGELREKRDRAEDAVMAVRGAIKHGVLPGGCWTLQYLASLVRLENDPILSDILSMSLNAPLIRILSNVGLTKEEIMQVIDASGKFNPHSQNQIVYDAMEQKWVKAFDTGLLDSTPAVLEALRNALSIASLLGTLGGTVVFARDLEFERREAGSTYSTMRDVENPTYDGSH